jgi:hypothetical protein
MFWQRAQVIGCDYYPTASRANARYVLAAIESRQSLFHHFRPFVWLAPISDTTQSS